MTRLLSAVFATVLLFAASPSRAALTQTYSSKHFRIYYTKGDDVRAGFVADRAELLLERLSEQLGDARDDWSPVPVMVYPTHEAFVGSTGEEFGERTVGRAYGGNLRIELDASEVYSPMNKIIAHELTHIIIFRILGSRWSELPLWAHEGIAKTLANEWDELDTDIIAQAAASGNVPALSKLETGFPKGLADVSYAVSASMIRYILEQTGMEFVRPVLAQVAEGRSFDEAVRDVTGKSVPDWERDWRRMLQRTYAPYGWLRTLGVVATLALPILAILAYLAILAKKRRYLEQYEWDDGYSPDIDREYWPPR